MKARTLGFQLAGLSALALLIYFTNSFMGHPIEALKNDAPPVEWTVYDMPRYGVAVDIPKGWRVRQELHGILLEDPDDGGLIGIRAVAEETSYHHLPLDEYAIERLTAHHPYLRDSLYALRKIESSASIAGLQFDPLLNENEPAPEAWLSPSTPTPITVTYFPSLFTGDSNTSVIELISVGRTGDVYPRFVQSFRYGFQTLSQSELLERKLIAYSETPDRSVAYVGETRGFEIDVDGDQVPELLIAGMRRTVEITEDKCFFRLLKKTTDGYARVLEQHYLENSFQDTDIKIINLDNRPGYEIFLRFYDYGNEYGNHSTTFIYHTEAGFRFTELGAFAEPHDINGDGTDEIVKSVNTYFGPGATASWYDIYAYEQGQIVESSSRFPEFYRNIVLPKYQTQIEQARSEMAESRVEKFRISVAYMLRRLQKYMKRSQQIADGVSVS